jgi:hypothetical protein
MKQRGARRQRKSITPLPDGGAETIPALLVLIRPVAAMGGAAAEDALGLVFESCHCVAQDDATALERVLRAATSRGHPGTGPPRRTVAGYGVTISQTLKL